MILHFDAAEPTSVIIALVFGPLNFISPQRADAHPLKRIISIPIKTRLMNEEDEKFRGRREKSRQLPPVAFIAEQLICGKTLTSKAMLILFLQSFLMPWR